MYNKIVLIGRLVADPELKTTQSGINVASFRIAVDRVRGSGGERKTDFINVVAWRQTGEFVCRYFKKGQRIGVEGSLQTRRYTDQGGANRTAYEVAAEHCFFVDPKSVSVEMWETPTDQAYEVIDDAADLPF